MKIVVLDGHTLNPGDNPWDPIRNVLQDSDEFVVYEKSLPHETVQNATGAEILLTNKTVLNRDTLMQLPDVKLICVLATGVNTVDVGAAIERGILVCNVPEYGTDSVAQFVMAQVLYFAHRVKLHDQQIRTHEWTKRGEFCFWDTPQLELANLTFGIIGYGRIGRAVAKLAKAFQMKVIVFSPSGPKDDGIATAKTLEEVLSMSDFLSLHCVLNEQTESLINQDTLSKMKPGAYLINTARGSLIDIPALVNALKSGSLAGAALDVVPQEPLPDTSPLFDAPNVLLTPHMAWSSVQARQRLMQTTADNIASFLNNSPQNQIT